MTSKEGLLPTIFGLLKIIDNYIRPSLIIQLNIWDIYIWTGYRNKLMHTVNVCLISKKLIAVIVTRWHGLIFEMFQLLVVNYLLTRKFSRKRKCCSCSSTAVPGGKFDSDIIHYLPGKVSSIINMPPRMPPRGPRCVRVFKLYMKREKLKNRRTKVCAEVAVLMAKITSLIMVDEVDAASPAVVQLWTQIQNLTRKRENISQQILDVEAEWRAV